MAFFSELVRAIAEVEGLDEMTVTGIGQNIRDAGFIRKGGRGRAAAKMTSADAANLLIAVNASNKAKDAPSTVEIFRSLMPLRVRSPLADIDFQDSAREDIRSHLEEYFSKHYLNVLQQPLGFGQVLEVLLQGFTPDAEGRLELEDYATDTFEIEFQWPIPQATVRVETYYESDEPHLERLTVYSPTVFGSDDANPSYDKRNVTTITWRTLKAVGQALAA